VITIHGVSEIRQCSNWPSMLYGIGKLIGRIAEVH